MRTKFNVFLTLMLALVVQLSFAQGKVITGVVTEAGTGDPLPGVNVVVKGTDIGAATDFDGKYTIKADKGQTLVFSFVGYNPVEKKVGDSNVINVNLKEGNQLETVVINALGVEVKKASQKGVAVSNVKARILQSTGETDAVSALNGKVSGVRINQSSGDPGAAPDILIRGQKSILLSTKPLFVVDGIPVVAGIGSSGVDGVERPSKIADIDPDDIESIKILKGGAAAALWGSKAANGVVLITTKRGKNARKGKVDISVHSTISLEEPLTKYPLQDKFGKGLNGVWTDSASGSKSGSWGDKIADRPGGPDDVDTASGKYFLDQDGKKWYPILTKKSKETYNDKNYDAVIGQGMYIKNGISMATATDKSKYYLSFNNLNQNGIFDESKYDKTNIKFNVTNKPIEKLTIKSNFQYSYTTQNAIQKGSNLSGLLLGLYRTPADFDNSGYIGTKFNPGHLTVYGSHRSYRRQLGTNYKQSPGYNNPLFTTRVQKNPYKSNHIISGINLQYKLYDWFTLISRGGIDYATSKSESYFPVNSGEDSAGRYSSYISSYTMLTGDLMGQINKNLTEDINMDLLMGVNFTQYKANSTSGYYRDFLINTDIPNSDNSIDKNNAPGFGTTITRKNAGYGSLTFSYKDLLFTTFTGRAERASTYNGLIFYPSASLAFDFTNLDAFKDNTILNEGTIRVNWSMVGSEPFAYILDTYYVGASDGNGWGDSWSSGSYDGSIWLSTTKGNPDIKPEKTTELEFGLDLKLFKNRVNLSATYYDSKSSDLLLAVEIPASSGFTNKWLNAAEMTNKGIELELGVDIIKKDNFKWNIGGTYTQNKNEVTDVAGSDYIGLNGFTSTSSGVAKGYAYGVLRTGLWKRDASGNLELDANGFPQHGPVGFAGDPNPDFRAGLHTDLKYKKLSMRVLFDASIGGDAWDGTTGALTYFGRTLETANEVTVSDTEAASIVNLDGDPINALPYAVDNGDGTWTVRGNLKDFGAGNVLLDQEWYRGVGGGFGPVGEQFFKDATWIKLREISLNYKLKSDVLKKAKISSISFGISGRNLYLWTKDKSWNIDPESNLSGASRGRGLQYFNHPTTKSFVFTTRINF